jgi:hypothetical protein
MTGSVLRFVAVSGTSIYTVQGTPTVGVPCVYSR